LELVDPSSWILILWLVSILIGTFLGVTFTYTIHKFHVWKKEKYK
jgi:phosphotransferase system  glucose/maltose/N-acetylglucosamine-specific IIC component